MAVLWLTKEDTFDPTGPYTEDAIHAASWILYKLTGEKYTGIFTSTDAYQSQDFPSLELTAAVIQGQVVNLPVFTNGFRNLRLRNSPVRSIGSISHNGVEWDPSTYSLRNNSYVVRSNGLPWLLDFTDLLVTYTHGTPVPRAGKQAAIRLANEFIHALKDDGLCTLPERVSSVSRQGMSYTILDPQEFIQNGKVGIYTVDLFISAANPNKARKQSKVFSADRPRGEKIN